MGLVFFALILASLDSKRGLQDCRRGLGSGFPRPGYVRASQGRRAGKDLGFGPWAWPLCFAASARIVFVRADICQSLSFEARGEKVQVRPRPPHGMGVDSATAARPRRQKLKFLGYLRQGYRLSPRPGSQQGPLHVLKLSANAGGGNNSPHDELEPGLGQ